MRVQDVKTKKWTTKGTIIEAPSPGNKSLEGQENQTTYQVCDIAKGGMCNLRTKKDKKGVIFTKCYLNLHRKFTDRASGFAHTKEEHITLRSSNSFTVIPAVPMMVQSIAALA